MSARGWLVAAGIVGFLGVLLGAFGAHGLEGLEKAGRVTARHVAVFRTGVQYLQLHALALIGVAWLATAARGRAVTVAGASFLAGGALFSGSLVLFGLSPLIAPPDGLPWLGMITPLGGLAFLAGWAALAVAARGLPSAMSGPSSSTGEPALKS